MGVFETLNENDVVISDETISSIIDGIVCAKAERKRYKHSDMGELEKILQETPAARFRLIATDGAFSMDGDLAKLPEICELAGKYQALVMVDDSHCTGFMGDKGRGSHEFFQVEGKVDIITSTLGKAMGGAGGVHQQEEIIEILSIQALSVLQHCPGDRFHWRPSCFEERDDLRKKLRNISYFRK
jgi:glycine C-acetyltransferase